MACGKSPWFRCRSISSSSVGPGSSPLLRTKSTNSETVVGAGIYRSLDFRASVGQHRENGRRVVGHPQRAATGWAPGRKSMEYPSRLWYLEYSVRGAGNPQAAGVIFNEKFGKYLPFRTVSPFRPDQRFRSIRELAYKIGGPRKRKNRMRRELTAVKAVCPHDCPDTCGMVVSVDPATGRAMELRGDRDHPFTRGFLCQKVVSLFGTGLPPGSLALSAAADRSARARAVRAHRLGRSDSRNRRTFPGHCRFP